VNSASSQAAASDPFGTTANPAHYVPRPATDRALDELERHLRGGARCVALVGPPGLGKTLLLKVLGEQLADVFQVARLPYPALSGAELCAWVLAALGAPEAADPEGALLDLAFRSAAGGREILLLVDDASALPPGAARSLATLVDASGGAVRLALAALEDERLRSVLAAFGSGVAEVRLVEAMSAEETAALVRARIGWAMGERAARFHPDTLLRIHRAAEGVPRRVHEIGSLVWRADPGTALPALVERWLRDETAAAAGAVPLPPPAMSDASEEEAAAAALDAGLETDLETELETELDHALEPEAVPAPVSPAAAGAERVDEAAERAPRRLGLWLAVAALAAVALAAPYLIERFEPWMAAPVRPAQVPALPPAEPPPAPEPPIVEEAPPLLPDEWALAGPLTSEEEPAGAEAEVSMDPALAEAVSEPGEPEPALAVAPAPEPEPPPAVARPVPPPAPEPPAVARPAPQAAPEPGTAPAPAVVRSESSPPAAAPQAAAPRRPPPGPPPVLVNVSAIPSALIHVDGGVVGETPLAGLPLSPGLHVFRAEFPDGRAVVRTVEISNESRHVTFE
jgi:type II secretory pathway predicted ATPase ExeA